MKYHLQIDTSLFKNPYKGLYIALEGIDGTGKTTQIERLKAYFEKKRRKVVITREPRKKVGIIAELNKKILEGKIKIPGAAFQYIFTADRIMHFEELVVPALKKGKVVITDRCFWSAIPYGAADVDKKFNRKKAQSLLVAQGVLAHHYQVIVPDITFYLDIPVKNSLERMSTLTKTKELYEEEDILIQVKKGYEWLRKQFPKEFLVIDAQQSIDEVTANMVQLIESKKLKQR